MAQPQSKKLPRERWAAFLDQLSRDYSGADATVELLAPDDQPQLLTYGQPLVEIVGADALTIRLGDGVEHVIERATGISVQADNDGLGQIIVFEAAGASPVRLTLARPMQRSIGGEGAVADDPAFIGGSAGAAGGSTAAGDGHDAPGVGDDYGPLITFGSSDDMGGVASVGGGSFGDQDLSGRRSYDITADVYGGRAEDLLDEASQAGDHIGPGSETTASGAISLSYAQGSSSAQTGHHKPDIIDGGGDQGVIDRTADPIEGSKLDPANSTADPYVEGEVGAQAERDLDDLADERPEQKRPAAKHRRERDS